MSGCFAAAAKDLSVSGISEVTVSETAEDSEEDFMCKRPRRKRKNIGKSVIMESQEVDSQPAAQLEVSEMKDDDNNNK